ncbi:Uncharacterised protein [Streptococcus pneumoniae]|nr:Uncharacterised protein [Streptococcus pneumoniae]CIQ76356.1 Uncharacterised protein [Streptococcus pneumoniae]CIU35539.1 Uncharacterised protein [Streptococcus pneumoniae]CIU62841.1 Uncharacterised protein [Streptococcus pneumoniae]CIU67776.1 Uncharacterised protein [Streptococcus pneumoniae]
MRILMINTVCGIRSIDTLLKKFAEIWRFNL